MPYYKSSFPCPCPDDDCECTFPKRNVPKMDETRFIQNIRKLSIVAPVEKLKEIIKCPRGTDQCKCTPTPRTPVCLNSDKLRDQGFHRPTKHKGKQTLKLSETRKKSKSPPKTSPIKTVGNHSPSERSSIKTTENHSQLERTLIKNSEKHSETETSIKKHSTPVKKHSQAETTDSTGAEKRTSKVSEIESIQGSKKASKTVLAEEEQNFMLEYGNWDKKTTTENLLRPRNCICEDQCVCSLSPPKSLSPIVSEIKQDEVKSEKSEEIVKQPCKCICGNEKCKCIRHPRKCIFITVAKTKPNQNGKKVSRVAEEDRCPCYQEQCKCNRQQSPLKTSEIKIIPVETGKIENESETTYKCQCGKAHCKCKRPPKKLSSPKAVKSDTEPPTKKCLCGKTQCKYNRPQETILEDTTIETIQKVDEEAPEPSPKRQKCLCSNNPCKCTCLMDKLLCATTPKANYSIQDIKEMSAAALIEQCLCGKDQSKCIRLREKLISVKVAQIESTEDVRDIKKISTTPLEELESSKINSIQAISLADLAKLDPAMISKINYLQNMSADSLIKLCKCNNERCQCNSVSKTLTSSRVAQSEHNQDLSSTNLRSVEGIKNISAARLNKLNPAASSKIDSFKHIENAAVAAKLCECYESNCRCKRLLQKLTSSNVAQVEPTRDLVNISIDSIAKPNTPEDCNQVVTKKICPCSTDLSKCARFSGISSSPKRTTVEPPQKQCKCVRLSGKDGFAIVPGVSSDEDASALNEEENSEGKSESADITKVLCEAYKCLCSKRQSLTRLCKCYNDLKRLNPTMNSIHGIKNMSADGVMKHCKCNNPQHQCLLERFASSKVEQSTHTISNISAPALQRLHAADGSKIDSIQNIKSISAAVLQKIESVIDSYEDIQNVSVDTLKKLYECNNEQCQCSRLLQKLTSSKVGQDKPTQQVKKISTAVLNKLDPAMTSKLSAIQDIQNISTAELIKLCECNNEQCQCNRLLKKLISSKVEQDKVSQKVKNSTASTPEKLESDHGSKIQSFRDIKKVSASDLEKLDPTNGSKIHSIREKLSVPGLEKLETSKISAIQDIETMTAVDLIKLCECKNEQCQCNRLLKKITSSKVEQDKASREIKNSIAATPNKLDTANGSKMHSIQDIKNISAAVLNKLDPAMASTLSAIQDIQNMSAGDLIKLCECNNEQCQCNHLLKKLTSSKAEQGKVSGKIKNSTALGLEKLDPENGSKINSIRDIKKISAAGLDKLDPVTASKISAIQDIETMSAADLIKLCECNNEQCQCNRLLKKLASLKVEQDKASREIANSSAVTLKKLDPANDSKMHSIQDIKNISAAVLETPDLAVASKISAIQGIQNMSAGDLIKLCDCKKEQCGCDYLQKMVRSSKQQDTASQEINSTTATAPVNDSKIHSIRDIKKISAVGLEKLDSSVASSKVAQDVATPQKLDPGNSSKINSIQDIKNIRAAVLNKLDSEVASKISAIQDIKNMSAAELIHLCECNNEVCQCNSPFKKSTASKMEQELRNVSAAALKKLDSKMNSSRDSKNVNAADLQKLDPVMASKTSGVRDIVTMSAGGLIKLCECNNEQCQCTDPLENCSSSKIEQVKPSQDIKHVSAASIEKLNSAIASKISAIQGIQTMTAASLIKLCECNKQQCQCNRHLKKLTSSKMEQDKASQDKISATGSHKLDPAMTSKINAIQGSQTMSAAALIKLCECINEQCQCSRPLEKLTSPKVEDVKLTQGIKKLSEAALEKLHPAIASKISVIQDTQMSAATLKKLCECKNVKNEQCECNRLLKTLTSSKGEQNKASQEITNTSAATLKKLDPANSSKIHSIRDIKNVCAAVSQRLDPGMASKVSAIQDIQTMSAAQLIKLCECIDEQCECDRPLKKLTSSKVEQVKPSQGTKYISTVALEKLGPTNGSKMHSIQDIKHISAAVLEELDPDIASKISVIQDIQSMSAADLIKLCQCTNEQCECNRVLEKITSSRVAQASQEIKNTSTATLEKLKSSNTFNIHSIQNPELASKENSIQGSQNLRASAALLKLCKCSNEQCQCSQGIKNISAAILEKLKSSKTSARNSIQDAEKVSVPNLEVFEPTMAYSKDEQATAVKKRQTSKTSNINSVRDIKNLSVGDLEELCECINEQLKCDRNRFSEEAPTKGNRNSQATVLEAFDPEMVSKIKLIRNIKNISAAALEELCKCINHECQCNPQQNNISEQLDFAHPSKIDFVQKECECRNDPCKCTCLLEDLVESGSIQQPCTCGKEQCECTRRPDTLVSSTVPGVSSDEDASAIKEDLNRKRHEENLHKKATEEDCLCSENLCECYDLLRTSLFNSYCSNPVPTPTIECVCDALEKDVSPKASEGEPVQNVKPPIEQAKLGKKKVHKKATDALSKICKCPCHKRNCKCHVPPEKINCSKVVKTRANHGIKEPSPSSTIEQENISIVEGQELNKEISQAFAKECECKCGKYGCECYDLLGTHAIQIVSEDDSSQDSNKNISTIDAVEQDGKTKTKKKKLNKTTKTFKQPYPRSSKIPTTPIQHKEKFLPPTCTCSRVKHISKRSRLSKKCMPKTRGFKSIQHVVSASDPISNQKNCVPPQECSCYDQQCKCASLLDKAEKNECSVCGKEKCTCKDFFQEEANRFVNEVRYELQMIRKDQFTVTDQELQPVVARKTSSFCKVCEDRKLCVILHNKERKADLLRFYREERDLETLFQSNQDRERSILFPSSNYKKKKSVFGGKRINMSHSFKQIQPMPELKPVSTKTKNIKKREAPNAPISHVDSDATVTTDGTTVETKKRSLLWYSSELPHTA